MELFVDIARCEGHGLCVEAAPALLRLNDDGVAELLTDDVDAYAAEARNAVRVCPVAALRLA